MHNLYENISLTNVNIYIYQIIWGCFCRMLGGLLSGWHLSGWLLSGWLLSVPHFRHVRNQEKESLYSNINTFK